MCEHIVLYEGDVIKIREDVEHESSILRELQGLLLTVKARITEDYEIDWPEKPATHYIYLTQYAIDRFAKKLMQSGELASGMPSNPSDSQAQPRPEQES